MRINSKIRPEDIGDQRIEFPLEQPLVHNFSTDLEATIPPQNEESSVACKNLSSSIPRQLMDVEILYLLNFGSKTGYDLKKQLLDLFKADVSYGTIYPHLHSLQESGLIEEISSERQQSSEAVLKKITYALTYLGTLALRESIASLSKISLSMHFTMNKVDSQLDSATLAEGKSNDRISTLHTLQAILERRRYTVAKDSIVKGFSGTDYQIEIIGTRTAKKRKERILVELIDERVGSSTGLDHAMKILARGQDIGAKVLLLAIPRLNTEVADFLNFHGIITFDGNTWQEVLSDFVVRFGKSLE